MKKHDAASFAAGRKAEREQWIKALQTICEMYRIMGKRDPVFRPYAVWIEKILPELTQAAEGGWTPLIKEKKK